MTLLSQTLGPLSAAGNLPLYQQLQRALRDAIDRRILGADDALPPERDLAGEFGVSRITVRKAIDGLVSEGLLMRRQGSGTFVRGRVEKNFSMLTSFSEDMRARGRTPRSEWLKRSAGTVTPRNRCAALEPRTPSFAFIGCGSRTTHRWRSIRDDRSVMPALPRCRRARCTTRSTAPEPAVRALQRLRAFCSRTSRPTPARETGVPDCSSSVWVSRRQLSRRILTVY